MKDLLMKDLLMKDLLMKTRLNLNSLVFCTRFVAKANAKAEC
jgi:hypothetical protein